MKSEQKQEKTILVKNHQILSAMLLVSNLEKFIEKINT